MNVLSLKQLSWARLVSDLLSPPVVVTVTGWFLAAHDADSPAEALWLAGIFTIVSVVLPFGVLAWWVYRGVVSDFHMPERQERYWPLLLSFVCSLLGWVALHLIGEDGGLYLLLSYMTVINLVGLGITFYWQISIHTGTITAVITIIALVFGLGVALPLCPLILLVGAARLKLKRHTAAQVVAGSLVAMGTVLVLYVVLKPNLS